MSDELPTVLGRRIIGWTQDESLITLVLDDGRIINFWAVEQCGDDPAVGYDIKANLAVQR